MPLIVFLLIAIPALMPSLTCSQGLPAPERTEIWDPQPPVVQPAESVIEAPDDAIILFDGTSLNNWQAMNGTEAGWVLNGDHMTVQPGTGDIISIPEFGDIQLHIEWRAPREIDGNGQGRGNSGIFLQNRYEVQVLDNWNNPTYVNGMAGSIYKQHIPLANPAREPGEWQSYDIFFKAPRFNNEQGELDEPARITVLLNGVLVQNNVEIYGPTIYRGIPEYEEHGKAGIRLQDHTDRVGFRNIWVRELDEEISSTDGVLANPR